MERCQLEHHILRPHDIRVSELKEIFIPSEKRLLIREDGRTMRIWGITMRLV